MRFIDFVCGIGTGWTHILVGQPLDFIKVRYQIGEGSHHNPLRLLNSIYKEFGLKGLYRGASSLFVGQAGVVGTEFFIFEWVKRIFYNMSNNVSGAYHPDKLDVWQVTMAGGLTGVVSSLIWCPMEYAKINKQISHTMKQSSIGLLFSELRSYGFQRIYRGFTVSMLR